MTDSIDFRRPRSVSGKLTHWATSRALHWLNLPSKYYQSFITSIIIVIVCVRKTGVFIVNEKIQYMLTGLIVSVDSRMIVSACVINDVFGLVFTGSYVIVRPLSTVGYTSIVESVIHSRQWSN